MAASLALGAGWPASGALAQAGGAWPQKLIRIVVANPTGGTADMIPRLIAEPLGIKLGQSIIVVNRPGAAGNIAAEYVFNAEPDGYTLMVSTPAPLSISVSLFTKLNYDPAKFVPLTVLAMQPNMLMIHPSLPVQTVQELIAYGKANPDKLNYASQGNGSTAHLTAELFKLKTGTRMLHVPYLGNPPAIAGLLAGYVNVMFGNGDNIMPNVRSGKLRLLAVTSSKRLASMPDIPTVNEIVPGILASVWFGLVAPPRTPPAIAARLSATVVDILRSPDIARRIAEAGALVVGNTPDEMAAWMKEETERWRAVIKAGNIRAD